MLACKNFNEEFLEYLLNSERLAFFWLKKDFQTIMHFISAYPRIWEFSLPVILKSQLAH